MNPLELAAARSPWRHIHVGEKLLLFVGLLLLTITLPPIALAPIMVILLVLAVYLEVPKKLLALLVLAPAGFIALGVGPLIFSVSGDGVTYLGWQGAAYVVARSIVAMTATMLLALTTPVPSILQSLRLPGPLAEVVLLMYRFIGTMLVTARSLRHAQSARLGKLTISSAAMQATTLFVLTFQRARALQEGLELRGDIESLAVATDRAPLRWWFIIATLVLFLVLWSASCGLTEYLSNATTGFCVTSR